MNSQEFLKPDDVYFLAQAARLHKQHGHRNATLIILAYRHSLSAGEISTLRWNMVDLHRQQLTLDRPDHPIHILTDSEVRALQRLHELYPESDCVFVSDNNKPMSPANIGEVIQAAAEFAEIPVSLTMLRESAARRTTDGQ